MEGKRGIKRVSKGGGGSSIPGLSRKLPLPTVLIICLAFMYLGYLVGKKPLEGKGNQQAHTASNEGSHQSEGTTEEQTRKMLEVESFEHGSTGNNQISHIPYQILSWHPRALLFPRFASKETCENIIKVAKLTLQPSGLALRKGETEDATKDIRTSSGTFLTAGSDPSGSLAWVEQRMAEATMIPVHHGEAFNVLRYNIGQKYNSHYDTFNPEEYGPQSSQRIASFLLYLSDVEEGGETMFPFENYDNMNSNYNYRDCIGLKVKPRQGDALLFYSVLTNGSFDKAALHGSCPVVKGEKWVATKWIRDKSLHNDF
eukprot:TRINITY_DN20037_c0_g1_i1.p1 TRINITY_DN20037_c0_g1~~TRINITY_DN20037_c0_g1_i1.p1  ORF type:complete len:314 (+),score=57.12 TRINITY_DN20037_c0_g1_i1:136-1077(+)